MKGLNIQLNLLFANALDLSCVTCDVCIYVIVILRLLFAHTFSSFPFSGINVVDRYDYLGYGSDCDECFDDEY